MPVTDHHDRAPETGQLVRTSYRQRSSEWFWKNARKVVVAVLGGTLLLLGIAMLVLPGPGWATIFAALALLATEFTWARWVLKHARERFNQIVQAAKDGLGGTDKNA